MKRITIVLMATACCLLLSAIPALAADVNNSYGAKQTSAAKETIYSRAMARGDNSLFLSAIEDAGLAYMLDASGPYTVLLPSDSAINSLPDEQWAFLTDPSNRERLRAVLEYHMLPGSIKAADFDTLSAVDTLYGQPLPLNWAGSTRQFASTARITDWDIQASNGYIHSVDAVLLPPTGFQVISTADEYSIFGEALEASGIDSSLDENEYYTVFVPADSAFANLPDEELEYLLLPENRPELRRIMNHYVLPGNWSAAQLSQRASAETVSGYELDLQNVAGGLMVNDARVVDSIPVYNGTIHVIDEVFMPDTAVAGSFFQRSNGNERYNLYDNYDQSDDKCYYEGESKGHSRNSSEHSGWHSNNGCGGGCNSDCGHKSGGCGHKSGGCGGCSSWNSRSWTSSSLTPGWWENWAY